MTIKNEIFKGHCDGGPWHGKYIEAEQQIIPLEAGLYQYHAPPVGWIWVAREVRVSKTPEAVPKTGSYKVEYPGGVKYFYYDDEPGRRLRPEQMTQEQAKAAAQEFARSIRKP